MLFFIDGFSEYNQILMAPENMEKTSFITKWGTYCYKVIQFGLKNTKTTYQRKRSGASWVGFSILVDSLPN